MSQPPSVTHAFSLAAARERNIWGHIFPEDARCIIVPDEDGDDGGPEGEELEKPEGVITDITPHPALASISFSRTFMDVIRRIRL
jgi:hypothetical protein